jgi:hypothetical protein
MMERVHEAYMSAKAGSDWRKRAALADAVGDVVVWPARLQHSPVCVADPTAVPALATVPSRAPDY